MCVKPIAVEDRGLVSCRNCWQCRSNRVNDLVGRCIAESRHSTRTLAVTLTYGGDAGVESCVLVYSDFQRFMKRLRFAGYSVRYIVAGEYGSKRGRAHWHVILFFNENKGKKLKFLDPDTDRARASMLKSYDRDVGAEYLPEVITDERFYWSHWTQGFVFIEKPSFNAFRYVLKYALKDQASEVSVGHLAMSKVPPLGAAYFRDVADQYIKQGLAPRSFIYTFSEEMRPDGQRREFLIQGASREAYLKYFTDKWAEVRGGEPPYSELIDEYTDRLAASDPEQEFLQFGRDLKAKAGPGWVGNINPRAKKILTGENGQIALVNEFGTYECVQLNERGQELWRRNLETRGEIRQALRGCLPAFKPRNPPRG